MSDSRLGQHLRIQNLRTVSRKNKEIEEGREEGGKERRLEMICVQLE
jgi:hypothetical protein